MKTINISDLKPGIYFDSPVYLDNEYIVLSPDTPLSNAILNRLKKWGYKTILTAGNIIDKPDYLKQEGEGKTPAVLDININEKKKMESAKLFYIELLEFTKNVFSVFLSENRLNINAITDKIKKLIEIENENRDNVLRFTESQINLPNYLIAHSVNTAILSITLGSFLKLTPHRMIELGLSSLLHDIGMFKLPQQLYLENRNLSDRERKILMTHTILGYRILKSFSLPENVALGAYEHHERMDGSGYPRHLKGEKISLYARIIAITCSYEAAIADRPFKNHLNGHQAILDLLKGNRTKYDENVFKALIYRLSIYPLGTFVLLSNNTKGVVAKADPNNPKFPYVKILTNEDGSPVSSESVIQTSKDGGILIKRCLTDEEIEKIKRT